MKPLLALMVFVYIAGSTYMDTILRRAQTFPVGTLEEAQRVKRYKPAIALAVIAKFSLVIAIFIIFFLHYHSLRHWIGSICFLIGMETLWAGFSRLRSARTQSIRITPSTDGTLEPFEKTSLSIKRILWPFLYSGVMLVAIPVFFYFDKKLYLYLSFWDLGGVVFFLASNHVWFVLYIRCRDVMVEKLQKAKATSSLGANLVPKQPDTP